MSAFANETNEHTTANELSTRLLDHRAGYDEEQLFIIFVFRKFVT
jgi:hypothetical protein